MHGLGAWDTTAPCSGAPTPVLLADRGSPGQPAAGAGGQRRRLRPPGAAEHLEGLALAKAGLHARGQFCAATPGAGRGPQGGGWPTAGPCEAGGMSGEQREGSGGFSRTGAWPPAWPPQQGDSWKDQCPVLRAHQQLFSPQLLLPFTQRQPEAVEERAMARIARLAAFINTCSLPQVGSPWCRQPRRPRPRSAAAALPISRLAQSRGWGWGPAAPLSRGPALPLSPGQLLLCRSHSGEASPPREAPLLHAGEAGGEPPPVLHFQERGDQARGSGGCAPPLHLHRAAKK